MHVTHIPGVRGLSQSAHMPAAPSPSLSPPSLAPVSAARKRPREAEASVHDEAKRARKMPLPVVERQPESVEEPSEKVDLSEAEAVAKLSLRAIIRNTTGGLVSQALAPPPPDTVIADTRPEQGASAASRGAFAPQVIVRDGRIVADASTVAVPAPVRRARVEAEAPPPRPRRAKVWDAEATRHFFQALRMCGSDFTLIARLFPERTRRDIRNKYRREEKQHPQLIDYALKHALPLDVSIFGDVSSSSSASSPSASQSASGSEDEA